MCSFAYFESSCNFLALCSRLKLCQDMCLYFPKLLSHINFVRLDFRLITLIISNTASNMSVSRITFFYDLDTIRIRTLIWSHTYCPRQFFCIVYLAIHNNRAHDLSSNSYWRIPLVEQCALSLIYNGFLLTLSGNCLLRSTTIYRFCHSPRSPIYYFQLSFP